ncbi:hypothetical protein [Chitinivorax sp. B]|uniref:hypothetical protein n=1 Tax=Chitinivorax sp. B TaxID=2502235 RepID=UPI0010F47E4A|nr:hypothetical protein [Chitinivorax sp. B]
MSRSRLEYGLLTLCAIAALIPLIRDMSAAEISNVPFPGWPSRFEGKTLKPLPLTALEQRFQHGFPGKLGRFTDGQREIILRWVTTPNRKLHPSIDCFRANGYQIELLPIRTDGQMQWSQFTAIKGSQKLVVTERITDADNRQWRDVSSWYWSATLGQSKGPWWAVTVAQQATANAS